MKCFPIIMLNLLIVATGTACSGTKQEASPQEPVKTSESLRYVPEKIKVTETSRYSPKQLKALEHVRYINRQIYLQYRKKKMVEEAALTGLTEAQIKSLQNLEAVQRIVDANPEEALFW